MGKKVWIILIIIFLLIASAAAYVYVAYLMPEKSSGSNSGSSSPAPILTNLTLPAYFEKQKLVQSLPSSAVISLKFYNTENKEKIIGDSYTITKSSVEEKEASNPDLIITVDSKYLPKFGNFCNAVKEARNNGEISFDMKLSKTSMLWKYKSVMKYRDCFGF